MADKASLRSLTTAQLTALKDALYAELLASANIHRTVSASGDVSVSKAFGIPPADLWNMVSSELERRGYVASGAPTSPVTRTRMVFNK